MKEKVAQALAQRVEDGAVLGIGSGSTTELTIRAIGERIAKERIRVSGIPTSIRSARLAAEAGVQVLHPAIDVEIDWAFDGADEVDPQLRLIKGNGAAMLNEKIIANRAAHFVVLVTDEKLVDRLGTVFPVPVETVAEGLSHVRDTLAVLGATEIELRPAERKYGPLITEHNNCVFDARFSAIAEDLEDRINQITGVVENGLFTKLDPEVLIARRDGVWSRKRDSGMVREEKVA